MFSRPGTQNPFLRLFGVVAVALSLLATAPVAEAAVASRVVVEGNQRIDDSTVAAYLTIRIGQSYGARQVDESIDALFATGLFQDVSITQRGSTLVVRVVENPVISQVSFEGNRKVSDAILSSAVQSRERGIFDSAKVQRDVATILEIYRRRGGFNTSVEPQTIDRGRGRVDLVFNVTEGSTATVARISFIGNRAFSDSRLRDQIGTKESGLLGFLRSTDTYDPIRLQQDQEILRRFYFNRGFADFRLISATADFDRERNQFFITFTVDEGEQYDFGAVRVDTTLADLDPTTLERRVQSRPGRRYSAQKIEKSLEDLTLEANRKGYPFAQVIPTGERNFETNTIDVVYRVDQGERAFVERIEIVGNSTTRDYVIRREFDISEGDAFNRILIDRAERRLRNLGFFETVQITNRRGSSPDRVIIEVRVLEKSTGKVSFGIGYSTSDGVIGDISIEEKNFLGRGQLVRASVGGGESTRNFNFAFTEPYLFGRRLRGGFDLFWRENDDDDDQSYSKNEIGGSLRLGVPLTENVLIQPFYTLTYRDIEINPGGCVGQNPNLSLAVCGSEGERITSLIGASLIYNTLDNQLNPREGFYGKLTTEVAGLGGDAAFLRGTAQARYYQEILPAFGVVGSLSVEGGAMQSLNDDLQIQDQFLLGGAKVRGFQTTGIGPRDVATQEALGGRYYFVSSAEATFPIPFLPPEIGLSGSVFADAGSVWSVDPDIVARNGGAATISSNDFAIRASGGVGVLWASPFGPIRADFAVPFLEEDEDKTQVFRLSGGTTF
ncbi:MAG: outer membrane protein assembly factor BamA [Pseudomonadota bacterium]